ncbi:MAG: hypothetical protein M5R36_22050 [Deltaproteobacteria bacterium]|nr:hypothetical protein [Deltaproteobacteria bacterium]
MADRPSRFPTLSSKHSNAGRRQLRATQHPRPYDFEIMDDQATEKKRAEAVAATLPVLDYDPNVFEKARLHLQSALTDLATGMRQDPDDAAARTEHLRKMTVKLNIPAERIDAEALRGVAEFGGLAPAALRLYDEAVGRKIADDLAEIRRLREPDAPPESADKVVLRNIENNKDETVPLESLRDAAGAKAAVEEKARELLKDLPRRSPRSR